MAESQDAQMGKIGVCDALAVLTSTHSVRLEAPQKDRIAREGPADTLSVAAPQVLLRNVALDGAPQQSAKYDRKGIVEPAQSIRALPNLSAYSRIVPLDDPPVFVDDVAYSFDHPLGVKFRPIRLPVDGVELATMTG